MKLKIKILIVLLLIFVSKNLFCQNISENNIAKTESRDSIQKNNLYLNELYLGYGIVNGGRVGYRLRFNDDLAAEISVGKNFLFNQGINKYYFSGGMNIYTKVYEGLFFSLLGVYEKRNDIYKNNFAFSFNIGYFDLNIEKKISVHLRGGPVFYTKQTSNDSSTLFGINLDASLGFIF